MPKINIAVASDQNYLPHAVTTIFSACTNSANSVGRCFLVSHEITSSDITDANTFLQGLTGHQIELIEAQPESIEGFQVTGHISAAAYLRFFLPDLLPEETQHILYLDADTLVLGSLAGLLPLVEATEKQTFEPDTRKLPLAWAVRESTGDHLREFGVVTNRYFNSGVMLINLARWREESITVRLVQLAQQWTGKLWWWDQDVLNIALKDAWLDLPYDYNVQETTTSQHLVVAHFTGDRKPWVYGCSHPQRQKYAEIRLLTPYGNFRRTGFWKFARKKIGLARLRKVFLRLQKKVRRLAKDISSR